MAAKQWARRKPPRQWRSLACGLCCQGAGCFPWQHDPAKERRGSPLDVGFVGTSMTQPNRTTSPPAGGNIHQPEVCSIVDPTAVQRASLSLARSPRRVHGEPKNSTHRRVNRRLGWTHSELPSFAHGRVVRSRSGGFVTGRRVPFVPIRAGESRSSANSRSLRPGGKPSTIGCEVRFTSTENLTLSRLTPDVRVVLDGRLRPRGIEFSHVAPWAEERCACHRCHGSGGHSRASRPSPGREPAKLVGGLA
jgi:hypothetical protein